MKLPCKIGMLNRKCQFRCAHRHSFQANIKVNQTKEYYLYIIYIHMISHVYITVICKWLFVFHEGVLTVKLVFFLLVCFRLSRGKLEKRLETGAHVVVKTHEWTGLISPKTFDEAKELFSHLDWTGIWWRFFWICDMWSIRYDSKYSWLDSWTLIIMIVLGRFGDVTMGETKSFFLCETAMVGPHTAETFLEVMWWWASGRTLMQIQPGWSSELRVGNEPPKLQSCYGGCIRDKLWIPVFQYVSTQIWGSHPFFLYKYLLSIILYTEGFVLWATLGPTLLVIFFPWIPKLRPRKVATHQIHFEELVAYDKAFTVIRVA